MLSSVAYKEILDRKQEQIDSLRERNEALLVEIETSKKTALIDRQGLDKAQKELDKLYDLIGYHKEALKAS